MDWQLIYISAGKGYFQLDGQEVVVSAGNMVLYQPKQMQRYHFLGEDRSQYWFVHFTGRQVRNILKQYEIPLEGYVLHTGLSYVYEDLFKRMRDELVECSWGYEELLTYLLRVLLMEMKRRMDLGAPKAAGFVLDEVNIAKDYFRDHYNEEIGIEQYAASRNMSTSWFGKSFIAGVGKSPKQYILEMRIHNGKAKGISPAKYRKVYLGQVPQS